MLGIATTVLLLLLLLIAAEDGEDREEKQQRAQAAKEEVAKKETDRKEAQRKAKEKEEAERKAQEEQARQEKEEADRKAKEEADRRAQEEAERKEKEEAERKEKEEAERIAKEEAERKAQREEESRMREEAWRKDHPEKYLQSLGLVKKGNAWQLKDATELKEQTENLHKKRVSLKKDLDGAKKTEREMPGRYKKLEKMLMVNLLKLKKTRSENPGERRQLVIWVGLLENQDFREDMINDDFPSKEELPQGWQWYAEKGPQTRDRLIEFLNKHGSSFERVQLQYRQSIQQLKDRKKGLDEGLNELLNSAREVHQFKNHVEEEWAAIDAEMDHVEEARGSAPIKPIKTTIEKAEESVAAVLELKEDIGNFLKPPSQEQRRPPPRRPGGNRPG